MRRSLSSGGMVASWDLPNGEVLQGYFQNSKFSGAKHPMGEASDGA
jgi:hypothetical protein